MKIKKTIPHFRILLWFLLLSVPSLLFAQRNFPVRPELGKMDIIVIQTSFKNGIPFRNRKPELIKLKNQFNEYLKTASNHQITVRKFEITRVLNSPLTKSQVLRQDTKIINTMRTLATQNGYNLKNKYIVYLMNLKNTDVFPSNRLAQASARKTGYKSGYMTLPFNSLNPEVFIHESLHMLNIAHADFLNTGSKVAQNYPGKRKGQDPHFMMGLSGISSGGLPPLPITLKRVLGWLKPSQMIDDNSKSKKKYRIFKHNATYIAPNRKVGIYLRNYDNDNTIFAISYTPGIKNKYTQRSGVSVHLAYATSHDYSLLIDLKPNSKGKNPIHGKRLDTEWEASDAFLYKGEQATIGDLFTLKVLNEGGRGNNQWADIEIIPKGASAPNTQVIPYDKEIAIRSVSGGGNPFLQVNPNTGANLATAGTKAPNQAWQTWERFVPKRHPNGQTAIYSLANNRYLQVDGNNKARQVSAKGPIKTVRPKAWERFEWRSLGSRRFALRSTVPTLAPTQWLQRRPNSKGVFPNGAQPRGWETFEYIVLPNQRGRKVINEEDILGINVYPNPVNQGEDISIDSQLLESGGVSVAVFDLTGALVYENNSDNVQVGATLSISTANFSSGMYIIKVVSNGITEIQKLVIK